MVSVGSIPTVTSMSKVKFQHSQVAVLLTNNSLKAITIAMSSAVLFALGLAIVSVMSDVAPKFIYDLDIMCNAM